MAYNKTSYVDGITPLNARNFNNNENALDQVVKDVASISQALVQVDDKIEGKADVGHSHSELHSHSNKSVLDGVTSAKVTEWNNKSNFSGNYNDLTNKPTIPTVDVNKSYVDTELAKKSNTGHEHSEYTTETRVSNMIAEAQLGGGEVDLSGYATKDDLRTKSDVGHGHSYNDLTNKPTIPSITGLATTTYVDTGLSKKSDTHTHPYKSDTYVPTWSEIAGKPTIPTVDVNKAYVDGELAKKSNTGHRHDASEIDNLPTSGGSSDVTKAYVDSQDKVLDDKITVLSDTVNNHLNNHPSGDGGSFEIITPNGKTIKVKAFNDGTLETELPVIPTSELPSDFPKFTVTGESLYKGNFLIAPHTGNYNFGYVFIANRKGEVLWYKKAEKGYCYGFKKYKNLKNQNRYTYMEVITGTEPTINNVTFYENCELVILNENFEEIDRVRHKKQGDIPANYPQESHDYIYIDDGHYVLLSYYQVQGSALYENSIQEIKMGKVVWHWQTRSHTELLSISHTTPTGDYAHINSIQIDYDNNFLVSFRNIGLVKINKITKEIMWVIGSKRCDFAGIESSQIPFQQHDIQFAGDGSFTVFDNYGHSSKSRVCRFFLDEQTMTCLSYKEYITTRDKSFYMGSATIVDDGNDILDIAYGSGWSDIAFEEYDFKNNKQLMLLKFNDGHDLYRVFRDLEFCNSSRLEINEPIITPVESINIDNDNVEVNISSSQTITATISPSDATNKKVVWSINNNNVELTPNGLSCSAKGLIAGSSIVTVTTEDGGFTDTCIIDVIDTSDDAVEDGYTRMKFVGQSYEKWSKVGWSAVGDTSVFEIDITPILANINFTATGDSVLLDAKSKEYTTKTVTNIKSSSEEAIAGTTYSSQKLLIIRINNSKLETQDVSGFMKYLSINNLEIDFKSKGYIEHKIEGLELGTLGTNGENVTSTTEVRTINFSNVETGKTKMLFSHITGNALGTYADSVWFYDDTKAFISRVNGNRSITIPSNARYFKTRFLGTLTNYDIRYMFE